MPLEQLRSEARRLHLANDPYWRRLLHFRRDLRGVYQSEIDDPRFFLAPHGRRDPAAELDADLVHFFDSPPSDENAQHAQCQFPARYAWLKEQLHFKTSELPEQPCPRFEEWSTRMDAGAVSVIFASYFMSNPASMYGHTFLRLGARSRQDDTHLLDYAVNYGADTPETRGVLFAIFGLTGGYRGRFSTLPYYMKVQEYNNLESRDLWEYDLRLTPAQVTRLVQHLWEMGSGSIAYFFINRNCSYELLPLLEVADPALDLSQPFHFKAIPMDTVRAILGSPGLVAKVFCRPSHVSVLLSERTRLTKPEVARADQLARTPHPLAEQSAFETTTASDRRALVLDTAYDDFRYRVGFKRPQPAPILARENELLTLRNAASIRTTTGTLSIPSLAVDPALSPDHGHGTGRLGLSYGFSSRSHFEEIALRPALHDLDDPSLGYTPGSQLQMFSLRLRYDSDRQKFYPQEFSVVDLAALPPWDRWVHHPSWQVGTGLAVADELPNDPDHALYWGFNGGSGITLPVGLSPHSIFYALAITDAGVGQVFRDHYRWGGGAKAGVLLEMSRTWRTHIEGSYVNYPLGNPDSVVTWRLIESLSLQKHLDLHCTLERKNQYKEVLFSALWYL